MTSGTNCYCCVPHCRSWAKRDKDKQLSFHQIPKKNSGKVYLETDAGRVLVDRQKAWIYMVGSGKPVTPYMKVCSLHFLPTDYFHKRPNANSRGQLKKTAVPSQNLPTCPKELSRESFIYIIDLNSKVPEQATREATEEGKAL
ncbi:hypothetical protein NQ315_009214 [Exocentrus adspersus]|uniref:THAP-type domain-containing protein n=1 Tax=Exocentrus adspersus TaxID=1586481 RepID=A0AAV8WG97_9CUCU|nr:hypothetical protein NQ315_009214 [Exocentrus adspersus]